MSAKVYSGRTKSDEWKAVSNGCGIYIKVDTTSAGFDTSRPVPVYLTSLVGDNNIWATTGATSIYKPTHTGFRVYIRWIDGGPLTPEFAEGLNWHITWLGRQE